MKLPLPTTSSFMLLVGAFIVGIPAASGGCAEGVSPTPNEDPPEPTAQAVTTQPISNVACLRKAALDLTERGPSAQEIDSVKSGAKSLGEVVDEYLSTPAFSDISLHWFLDKFEPTALVPASADKQEPARIAQYLITNDIDFRELVTAEYSVGTDMTRRPIGPTAAGILSTQTYLSAYTGLENRNWGGQVIRGLTGVVLVPVSEVPDDIDSSKPGLAANPACAGCHVNPIYGVDYAASFHDCYNDSGLPISGCVRQNDSQFLGQTGRTLADLGRILAASVEWRAMMIQTFYSNLGGRQIGKNETAQYRNYERQWIAADYKPKTLIKHIVTSSQYCSR